jgi:brefeldin A-resistance guanine nucleotide exchange factor 1
MASQVHTAWGRPTASLWDTAWCPVLQGMARLCCDSRAAVRTQALTLLQRSLLVPDLQVLSPAQWEFAFLRVLFPMLRKLLELGQGSQGGHDRQGREETKLRASMMLSKVFLQHLQPLASLPTFTALWLTILDMIGQFCASASTDILSDALPESLKNMLLVMDTR